MTAAAAGRRSVNAGLLLTVLVFVLLGPLVGGALMIAGLGVTIGVETGQYGGMLATIATMMIYGLWTSWFMGALPAFVVGSVIALADASGRSNWLVAAVIGSGAGAAMALAAGGRRNLAVAACYFIAAVAATLACYAATRRLARR